VTDIIAGMTASFLAKRQAKSLAADRARKLATDDKLAQKEYQSAREAMLGKDFPTNPDGQPCVPCMANAKAARRAARLNLVNQSIAGCPDHADAAARLRRDMDDVENARAAKAVYLKYDPDAPAELKVPPPGFLEPSDEELASLGLKQSMLAPDNTNFRAAVYKRDPAVWGDDPQPAYDVVFRGSTLAPEDWQNNFAQNANNESSYYQRAVRIGNALAESGNSDQVLIVGHSLGGGLASAAQGGSGAMATTFNAAGLNPKTVARYSTLDDHTSSDASKITAYRVDGEVLTKTNESGVTQYFSHPAVGQKVQTPVTDPAMSADDRHGMDEVIGSIEKEKQADEQTLKDCLGVC
jgi:hypothetical protein